MGAKLTPISVTQDDGYRGIWYMNQPTGDAYRYKYSGGFATYPQQHVPIAVHAAQAGKTFFAYGGSPRGKNELLHMVGRKWRSIESPDVVGIWG